MDMNNITLLDLIDRRTLQTLQDAFADATGMAALATDDTGAVTQLSNPTDFCMTFTRKSPIGCERCNKCDLQGGAEANRTGRPAVYYCHGGLVDFAAPIIINGRHVGSLIGGQVLTEEPDEEKFRKIAQEINVDPDEYIKALRKIKIVPKKQVDAAANLLYHIANSLSEAGYQKMMAIERETAANETNVKMSGIFGSANTKINETTERIKALAESITNIRNSVASSAKAVEATDSIVKTIENASTQLTLIGFNASIEAKRAGAAGAGFNVIAQEVRTLADRNTKQAGEIETTLSGIKKAIADINKQINEIHAEIEKSVTSFDEVQSLVAELAEMAKAEQ